MIVLIKLDFRNLVDNYCLSKNSTQNVSGFLSE